MYYYRNKITFLPLNPWYSGIYWYSSILGVGNWLADTLPTPAEPVDATKIQRIWHKLQPPKMFVNI